MGRWRAASRCRHDVPAKFLARCFADEAEVNETIEVGESMRNLIVAVSNLAGRKWRAPATVALSDSESPAAPPPRWSDWVWLNFERAVRKVAPPLGLLRFAPAYPPEFGLFVHMTKR
jgi:hypothetical protein